MDTRFPSALKDKQNGVVLLVALVLLVVVTVLGLSGMSTTTLEYLMSSNQQARVNAFQQAESGIDAVSSDLTNFPVAGVLGATRCTAGFDNSRYTNASSEVTCGSYDVSVPTSFDLTYSRADITRIPPLLSPAPRYFETSAERMKVATFEVDSRYDARKIKGGRAQHDQGIIVTVLTPGEETVVRGSDIDTN